MAPFAADVIQNVGYRHDTDGMALVHDHETANRMPAHQVGGRCSDVPGSAVTTPVVIRSATVSFFG